MHRDCELHIGPAPGRHLRATDLCLEGVFTSSVTAHASTMDEPVFRNSHNDHALREIFHLSARVLVAKYPHVPFIPTPCGDIGRHSHQVPAS